MSDSKKKRMSMLDSLAAAGAATAPPSVSRPMRAAREAVDGHRLWELDPAQIVDDRVTDRLNSDDVEDLRDSIEATGQTVPILVRRHPTEAEKFLLVYGRRRLEAIRHSDKVTKVRALVASLDEGAAVEAQVSENLARRDLSFIERALFAHELIESGYGNQSRVAEVLTVTRSSVSMAMGIVTALGPALIRAIGPAHGVGRPRWEELAKAIESYPDSEELIEIAQTAYSDAAYAAVQGEPVDDPSVHAFEAVLTAARPAEVTAPPAPQRKRKARPNPLWIGDNEGGRFTRSDKGTTLEIDPGPFADWVADQAQDLMEELHTRWKERGEA